MDKHGADHREVFLNLRTAQVRQTSDHPSKQLVLACLLIGMVWFVFWPVLHGEFFFDDLGYIVGNHLVTSPEGLQRIWLGDGMVDYWPLSFSVFWLEWRLFGHDTLGYHVVNLLLHTACCLVLWRIFALWQIRGAWLCALLFGIHPGNSLTVSWIFQTRTTLAGLLCALTVWVWTRTRDRPTAWSSALVWSLFVLSLLAKPIGILLPLFWLYAELTSERGLHRPQVLRALPLWGSALILGSIGLWFQNWKQASTDEFQLNLGLMERLFQVTRAFGFYVRQAFFPSNLMLIHPQWPPAESDIAGLFGSIVICLTLGIVVTLAWRYKPWQQSGRAVAWFILALAPHVGLIYIPFFVYAPVSEHYLYLALPGALYLLVSALNGMPPRWQKIRTIMLTALIGFYSVYSRARAEVYRREESVWQETIAKNPNSWLAYYNRGVRFYRLGYRQKAALDFEQALRLRPNLAEAAYNLGVMAHEQMDLPLAESYLVQAIKLRQDFCTARNLLAVVYYRTQRLAAAAKAWQDVVSRCGNFAEAHYNLAVALAHQGFYEAAKQHLSSALSLTPSFQEHRFSVSSEFRMQAEAKRLLDSLRSRSPSLPSETTN